MEAADLRFEISEDASALIRARRGQLWIWPALDRRPLPVLAWVFAVLWALRFVGVSSGWLWAGRTALLGALTIAALAARVWEKITDSADASLG